MRTGRARRTQQRAVHVEGGARDVDPLRVGVEARPPPRSELVQLDEGRHAARLCTAHRSIRMGRESGPRKGARQGGTHGVHGRTAVGE